MASVIKKYKQYLICYKVQLAKVFISEMCGKYYNKNNYFGIKDSSTSGGKGSVTMSTYEYYDGEKQREQANFAKFEDDSV